MAMAQWCANEIWPRSGRDFGNCTTMGVILDDRLIAVVVFHNWEPAHGVIELSAASTNKRWLNRSILHEMFSYCFEQAGAQSVVTRTAPGDKSLSRIFKAYGFEQFRIPRLRGRDEDEIIHTLTDDAWNSSRFERSNHGKKIQRAQAA